MIYWYFGILLVLGALSLIRTVLAISGMLVIPGIILIAADNLLVYSILLLPFFLWPRAMMRKPVIAALAVLPALIVAFGFPLYAQSRRDAFIAQQTQQDFDNAGKVEKVKTIGFVVARTADLTCNEICERLLYNREADKVVKTYFENATMQGTPQTAAYRIEKRATCETGPGTPGIYSTGAQARRAAGECIVREQNIDPEIADVTISERPLYYSGGLWNDPREGNDRSLFNLTSIETLSLTLGGPRNGKPVLRRTTVVASTPTMPLHITTTNDVFSPELMIATSTAPHSSYVAEQVLKQKLGFRLEEVAKP